MSYTALLRTPYAFSIALSSGYFAGKSILRISAPQENHRKRGEALNSCIIVHKFGLIVPQRNRSS